MREKQRDEQDDPDSGTRPGGTRKGENTPDKYWDQGDPSRPRGAPRPSPDSPPQSCAGRGLGGPRGAGCSVGSPDQGCPPRGRPTPGSPQMEVRVPETSEDGEPEEDTAAALQRLVALTTPRVAPVRSLRVQYRFIRKLGSGSYGRVLLARPRHGGPAVALKLLPRASVLRTTFLREFCVGRCVSSHPGLLQTLGGPLQTPRYFAFAQEYAPCGDLSGMLQEKGLPELMVKRVAAQLAAALDFLHGRGLVHADVKPDNVLVFDPACSRVALGDLGLTRPEGSPTPAPPAPLPTAPPELCLLPPPDMLPLRPSVDAWALGVLLFCAATAHFPWDVALAPDPAFEAFAGWMTTRPRALQPPAPWDQFAPPALTLLQGLLELDPETRSPPLAVLDVLGDDWGLEGSGGPLGGVEHVSHEEEEEEGSSLEEWTEEEEKEEEEEEEEEEEGGSRRVSTGLKGAQLRD